MRILLDTHVWLWCLSAPEKLGVESLALIQSTDSDIYLSSVSSWELAIKSALGKIELPAPLEYLIEDSLRTNGFRTLDITHAHSCKVGKLPDHHRDPFDRLLIAQALAEGLTLLTGDERLLSYPCATMWAYD